MILSDRDILQRMQAGDLKIESQTEDVSKRITCASVDLRLGRFFKIYRHSKFPMLDPKDKSQANLTDMVEVKGDDPFIVQPGEFILGVTAEKVTVPVDLVARVEGRSSLGRLGLLIHATAGFIDPGFSGTITLEISNVNRMPIAIYPGQRICQLAFEKMTSEAAVPYNKKQDAKYFGQELPEESRVLNDTEFN